jgi:hypothetical protein
MQHDYWRVFSLILALSGCFGIGLRTEAQNVQILLNWATPLRITNEPQDSVINQGEPLALSVGVEGEPVNYRWFKTPSTTPLFGGTGPTFVVAVAQGSTSGDYYVIATNIVNAVTSRVAKVVALPDTTGPLAIEAYGDNNTFRNRGGAKTLVITFNEGLIQSVSTYLANFAVYAGTNFNTRLTFTNALYNFSTRPRVYLFMSDSRWLWGSNYFVVINNVADIKGNRIAPNTRVPVCWPASGGGPALPCSRLPSEPPPGQLLLSIKRQGDAAVVSWPSAFGGYFLQYTSDFEPSFTWITVSDQTNPYTSTLGDGPRLFRLRKP